MWMELFTALCMIQCDMLYDDTEGFGMVENDVKWYGIVWYGMV